MKPIADYSEHQLTALLSQLKTRYKEAQAQKLKLNMARGKPAATQLCLSNGLLEKMEDYTLADGTDARNYGILEGIPECRELFGKLLDIPPGQIIIGGNSSLNMMFDILSFLCLFGTEGSKPWLYYKYCNTPVKFLCPVPGYDRHFTICEELGIEMIPIPLGEDGPDMALVKKLVLEDKSVKGIWCVPLHSNPQGVCYSEEVVEQLASMETASKDFRIFWDNAYGIHHISEEVPLKNIINECEKHGNPNRVYYFFSTSKISFPGAGVALVASSTENITELKKHMSAQTIGHDKLNQLRHVQFFKTSENVLHHMKKLAGDLKPKFDMVADKLEKDLAGSGLASWSNPKGGYFVSLDTLPGCARRTIELAENAGVTLTEAGAAYPYGKDPEDSNIRIAPTYPAIDELKKAMDIFIICVKIAGIEKILENKTK